MFVENEDVIYRGMSGRISCITDMYVVMELPAAEGRNSARVLIFHSEYSKVQKEK